MASSISQEFVDGVYEIYSNFYSDDIQYLPFDPANISNIYGESTSKSYLDPVTLVGMVTYNTMIASRIEKVNTYDLALDIPSKSFDLVGITITPTNFTDINKGVFTYEGKTYYIDYMQVGTLINGVALNYLFQCKEVS